MTNSIRGAFRGLGDEWRSTLRALRRSPRFAISTIIILGAGLGLNAATLSIVKATFFRPLPVVHAEELIYVFSATGGGIDPHDFQQEYGALVAATTAHAPAFAIAGDDMDARRLRGHVVPSNYFDVLGVQMLLGRGLRPEDDQLGSTQPVVVISHDYWSRQYGTDPAILGTKMFLDGRPFTIVGVTPERFSGLSEVWSPAAFWTTPAQFYGAAYRGTHSNLVARLRPGVTIQQVRSIQAATPSAADPRALSAYRIRRAIDVPLPFDPDGGAGVRAMVAAALVITGAVLLIGSVNIAGVLMSRSVTRATELAVRSALGASGLLLVRHLFVEALALAVGGGILGLGLAPLLISTYVKVSADRFPIQPALDGSALAFTVTLCVLVAVCVGVWPAAQAARLDVTTQLTGGAAVARPFRRRLQLVVLLPQISLSIGLLAVAGVHMRAAIRTDLSSLGYRVNDTVAVKFDRGEASDTEHASVSSEAFFASALRRVRDALPGAQVGLVSMLPPLAPASPLVVVSQDGGNTRAGGAATGYVSRGALGALGIAQLAGRDFSEADTAGSLPVAILSRALASRLFPLDDAIGKSVAFSSGRDAARLEWLQVVGVVADIRPAIPDGRERPFLYRPTTQITLSGGYPLELVATGRYAPGALVIAVKSGILSGAPDARLWEARPMSEVLDGIVYFHRLAAWILALTGGAGLLLAGLGVYGTISHSMAHRVKDLAIRCTLGANQGEIIGMIVREALAVVAVAAVPGLLAAQILLHVASQLTGAGDTSHVTAFAGATLVVLIVGSLAAFMPARRAASTDPYEALRRI